MREEAAAGDYIDRGGSNVCALLLLEYEFNVGPETGQKLHSVFLHTFIVV
jgi:hypothetical protein